jgi:4-amino-4-deoxy-L-arabinose transferase-like glycosyltransferase
VTPTSDPAPHPQRPGNTGLWLFACMVLAVTLARLAVVAATPLSLGPDEAQYWGWGQTLDWGYFSKPPLVGWAGGLAPLLGGDSAFGVRWPSPFLHALGAFGVWAFAGRAFGTRAGWFAGLFYLLAPGVSLSSYLLSTDALMLPLVAFALYGLQRMREGPGSTLALAGWGALVGALLGLATLGKYAALYVPAGLAVGMLLDRPVRNALLSWGGVAMLAALLAVISPNLMWNAANGGATISHTVGNASLGNTSLSLADPLEFLAAQFGVIGLVAWPLGLWLALRGLFDASAPGRAWGGTVLVPMLVVVAVATASRANANWAAVALPGLCALAGAVLAGWSSPRLANWTAGVALALQLLLAAVVSAGIASPAFADRIGQTAAIADLRSWPQTVDALETKARALGAGGIVVDSRGLYHGLQFAGRDRLRTPDDTRGPACACDDTRLLLRTWRSWNGALNHAEGVGGLTPGTGGVWLLASEKAGFRPFFPGDFTRLEPVGDVTIPLGPGRNRSLALYVVEGVKPVTRTRADLAAGGAPAPEALP